MGRLKTIGLVFLFLIQSTFAIATSACIEKDVPEKPHCQEAALEIATELSSSCKINCDVLSSSYVAYAPKLFSEVKHPQVTFVGLVESVQASVTSPPYRPPIVS